MSEQQPFGRPANRGGQGTPQVPRLHTPPPAGHLPGPVAPPATPAPLGRYIRWQMLLAVLGIILLTLLMGVTAYNVSTVLVPERGGVFREGVAGNPQYINPLLCHTHEIDRDLCSLLFRGLTRLDQQGRVVPDLAERWTAPDGLVYTFTLRENQFWHDGKPVIIDDVLFTIEMMQNPDSPILPDLAELWRSVTVEPVDEYTVRLLLDEPFAPFLDFTTVGLLPKHIWQDVPPSELLTSPLNARPVGNGPMQATLTSAQFIRLERSPFSNEDIPMVSALEFHFYPDFPSIYAAYTEGELDGVSQVMQSDIALAKARTDLQLFSAPLSTYVGVIFNLQNPDVPFLQDANVRRALYHALDRERLLSDVVGGHGVLASSPIPSNNWGHAPDTRTYEYSPNEAQRLLNESGWVDSDGDGVRDKDGLPMQLILLTNDGPTRIALIEQIAADWQAVGVKVMVESVSFGGFVTNFLTPRRFEAALLSWDITGDPDPFPLYHSSQVETGQNFGGWSNEDADTLMIEARSTVDPEKRKLLYALFQHIFADDVPAIPLYYPVYTYGVSERVKSVQIGPLNTPADRFATFPNWYILTRRVPANQQLSGN
ncbi:MAG: peptide ABC transporter substrate-binding protein [Caldilineaceae bacterium]|nr:peptide ABC transporter substrate-binding protein [Caldilineaceae bacterium]